MTMSRRPYVITGDEVRRLMRTHHRTIRGIAHSYSLSMARVRQMREPHFRATGFLAENIYFLCTGRWPRTTP